MFVGDSPTASSGEVTEGSRETTYLERKALAAQGIWGRVRETESGCWEWQAATNGDGYGYVCVGARSVPMHRIICELFNGPLRLTENACHSCNNPICCNPKHLARGTDLDNNHDYIESNGRGRPRALTREQVEEARALRASGGWTLSALGNRYGVTSSAMSRWLKGVARPDRKPGSGRITDAR